MLDVSGPLGGTPADPKQPSPPKVPTSGQKVTIDFGEASQALAHLEDVYNNLADARRNVEQLINIGTMRPGNDSHSMGFAGQNDPVIASVKKTLDKHLADVKAQYKNLKASLEQYSQNEFGNKGNFDNLK